MFVSILIPIYNVERWIERCARSLLGQSWADAEFIFVDDASPDASIEILRRVVAEYPSHNVRILTHATNKGLAAARQTAVQAARGEYVLHVDSDDWLADRALEKLAAVAGNADIVAFDYFEDYGSRQRLRACLKFPVLALACSFCSIFHPSLVTMEPHCSLVRAKNGIKNSGAIASAGKFKQALRHAGLPTVGALLRRQAAQNLWNKLIKRSLYENFPFAPELDYGEDFYAAAILASRARAIIYIEEPFYYYNCANAGAMSTQPSAAKVEQMIALCRLLEHELLDHAADMPAMWQHTKVALLQSAGREGWLLARTLPDPCLRSLNASQRLALRLSWPMMKLYRKLAKIKNQ